jgi:hypothetical protein
VGFPLGIYPANPFSLLASGYFSLQLVGEVFEEDHVALRLPRFRGRYRHERNDALAARRKIRQTSSATVCPDRLAARFLVETAPTTEVATFAQTNTGVAYANPSTTQSATITFTVYNNAGVRLGSQNLTLGPLADGPSNIGPLLGIASFTGFVKITSTIPTISLSPNFEVAPIFSSLPPGDLPSTTPLVTP